MAELALRWILAEPTVSTTIPGTRKVEHFAANLAAGDGHSFAPNLLEQLKAHRWNRSPTDWSQ
jgi:aryl-alcohol dehydrogenase-like predicted oxidoreductase